MTKNIFGAIVLLLSFSAACPGEAATLSWTPPDTYATGSPIDPAKVGKIVVRAYAGPTRKGPWKWVATSLPGASSVTVPDPSSGEILWYTCKATLDGEESGYATPVWKIKFVDLKKTTSFIRRIHIPHAKKIALLLALFLLSGLFLAVRFLRKKRVGKRR